MIHKNTTSEIRIYWSRACDGGLFSVYSGNLFCVLRAPRCRNATCRYTASRYVLVWDFYSYSCNASLISISVLLLYFHPASLSLRVAGCFFFLVRPHESLFAFGTISWTHRLSDVGKGLWPSFICRQRDASTDTICEIIPRRRPPSFDTMLH